VNGFIHIWSDVVVLTLFRTVRLFRLVRFTRMVRSSQMFIELTVMMDMVPQGLATISWISCLLALLIFMLGLVMRQTLGRWCVERDGEEAYEWCAGHLQDYSGRLFSTVPRACFTVFRCFTEGCMSVDGTPLLVHVMEASWAGFFTALVYFFVYICVVFGIFNIITGILVEKTVSCGHLREAVIEEDKRQKLRRHGEKFRSLLKAFCKNNDRASRIDGGEYDNPSGRALTFPSVFRATSAGDAPMDIKRDVFAYVLQLDMVQGLMEEMTISVTNGERIFDLIDVEEQGILDIDELVSEIVESLEHLQRSDEDVLAETNLRRMRHRRAVAHARQLTS